MYLFYVFTIVIFTNATRNIHSESVKNKFWCKNRSAIQISTHVNVHLTKEIDSDSHQLCKVRNLGNY